MPKIAAVGTATPDHKITKAEGQMFARHLFQDQFRDIDRLLTVFDSAQIESRYFAAPLEWFSTPHGWAEKNKLFLVQALRLCQQAITNCLEKIEMDVKEIDQLVLVTSTGLATPSLDAHLFNTMGFRQNIARTPLWGLGCAGGAAGLARGFSFAKACPKEKVLVCCVELCSLTFVHADRSKSNLIATSLFADGAAAALLVGDEVQAPFNSPKFLASQSTIWHESTDVMGWDITDDGMKVIFSKDIPTIVETEIKPQLDHFLFSQGIENGQLDRLIAHPGGMKVLQAYEQALTLPEGKLKHARDILQQYGNMSSCTVLFVLEREMNEVHTSGETGLVLALGPGFSCEQVLVRW
ncbi:type III polyketide synthase [Brevibacillus daliensis]|uniref:type III polyketide synthase n=1 Tax=Brevibacillus daliensis TaxID=2892995 RepID=UPI001E3A4BE2|nr:3-oxoacyl-[acyl-carrier-protein] synthase III C-terminal domain-containing protein [Brevibacillus daliensis]